VYTCRYLIN